MNTSFHLVPLGRPRSRATYWPATVLALAAAVFLGGAAHAESRVEIQRMIIEEALSTQVPPALALAVGRVESNFDAAALSSAGARGVMQIMPATARGEYGVGADELWDARLNIQLGIDFLEQLHRRYGSWDLALSHYNAGSVRGVGAHARILPVTRRYVESVRRWERNYTQYAAIWQPELLRPAWTPARTRPAASDFTGETEITVAVAQLAAEVGRRERAVTAAERTPRVRIARIAVDRRSLDDFGPDVAERRIKARAGLDDFAAIIRWSDG